MPAKYHPGISRIEQATRDAIKEVILSEAIAAGAQGIPSGHLYAALMPMMSLPAYDAMLGEMVAAGQVVVRAHVIYAPEVK